MNYPRFHNSSFWYKPVPSIVPLHEQSTSLVTAFLRQKARGIDDLVVVNTSSFAAPVYEAEPQIPTVVVAVDNIAGFPRAASDELAARLASVPIPEFAVPADGSDSEMAIYQPSTDTLWEFWQLRYTGKGWICSWGGRLDKVTRSDGIWPFPFGTTATGLPLVGGQITAEDLSEGTIDHVMGIALRQAAIKADRSWPALRSDGEGCFNERGQPEEFCIPEGIRFRLDPAVDVDAIGLSPAAKVIAKAAQLYGFVVWDKAGTTSLRAKNPKSYTQLGLPDPYEAFFSEPNNQFTLLEKIPWDRLQFLPKDFGKPVDHID